MGTNYTCLVYEIMMVFEQRCMAAKHKFAYIWYNVSVYWRSFEIIGIIPFRQTQSSFYVEKHIIAQLAKFQKSTLDKLLLEHVCN